MSDVLHGLQIHIHDRGEYWQAVITTHPKQSFFMEKTKMDYPAMKLFARQVFTEMLSAPTQGVIL